MRRSTIAWTDFSGGDANFMIGCTPASEGCAHCYAAAWAKRNGRDFSQVTLYPDKLERLQKADFATAPLEGFPAHNVRGRGARPLVFVCDLGDLFHDAVPDEFILAALRVMANRPDVDWQILTKRPRRALQFYGPLSRAPNIWFGVTAENQKRADERIPVLLCIPAAVRFVSVEPMLGPLVLRLDDDFSDHGHGRGWRGLSWVICGAESGPHRRPFDPAWAADLYRQCRDAEVAFFAKQASGYRPGTPLLIDGRVIHEFPEVDR